MLRIFELIICGLLKSQYAQNQYAQSMKASPISFFRIGQVLQTLKVLAKTWITLASWFPIQKQVNIQFFLLKTLNFEKFCTVPWFWN